MNRETEDKLFDVFIQLLRGFFLGARKT